MVQLRLIDHHVHGVISAELDHDAIESMLTEGSPAAGTTAFDTQLGFAVRRWCAPLLDLQPRAPAADYVRRRPELGSAETARRMLTAARVDAWLVDTGYQSDAVTTPDELTQVSGAPAREIARLEPIAERVARAGGSAASFADDLAAAVHQAAAGAVGFKSIAAYRGGLALEAARPQATDVETAASRWLHEISPGTPARLEDQVLIRHGIWAALDTGLPLQFHTGYGDSDSRLQRADPALLHGRGRGAQPRRRTIGRPRPAPRSHRAPRPGQPPPCAVDVAETQPRAAQLHQRPGGAIAQDVSVLVGARRVRPLPAAVRQITAQPGRVVNRPALGLSPVQRLCRFL